MRYLISQLRHSTDAPESLAHDWICVWRLLLADLHLYVALYTRNQRVRFLALQYIVL